MKIVSFQMGCIPFISTENAALVINAGFKVCRLKHLRSPTANKSKIYAQNRHNESVASRDIRALGTTVRHDAFTLYALAKLLLAAKAPKASCII